MLLLGSMVPLNIKFQAEVWSVFTYKYVRPIGIQEGSLFLQAKVP